MTVHERTLRRYQLLGDVRAFDGDEALALGASKPRSLLAILLLRAGSVVPTEVACDLLWSGEPPRSAATTLHGYISGLRRALGADAISTESPGYVIHLESDQLDTATFAELVTQGRRAAEGSDYDLAAQAFRAALDLWRGPALTGVTDQPWAVADAARLEEARLAATEDWAGVELQLGRHAEIVESLQASVRGAPLRENLRGRLALSLYRSGRQAEALQCLADGRQLLADELGIDPGAALVELQAGILAQDPALQHRAISSARATLVEDRPTPPLVPGSGASFVGRAHELGELRLSLEQALGGTASVVVVGGEPGIGKTELTSVIAEEAERRGAVVAWGRCHEGTGAPAYWPWAEITDALVRRLGDAEVDAAAGAGIADLAALGASLIGHEDAVRADPQSARFRTGRALVSLLASLASGRPIVLVVDDLQWADPPSLELLGVVVRSLDQARVLVVCTLRTSGPLSPSVTRALAELARTRYRRLALTGLDETAVGELVARGAVGLPQSEVAELRRRTAGNPLFVTQFASWLGAVSTSGIRPALPAEVGDVVRERIGRLPEATATLLSEASILGTELDIDGLTAVTALAPATVLEALTPALDASLLVGDEVPGRWRFVHGIVAETLRSDLGPDRSARLHLRAAAGLGELHGGRPGPHLSSHAAHLAEAAPLVDRSEVVAALTAAATWNADHLAFEQAFAQVDRGMEIVGGMPEGEARDSAELGVQGLRTRLLLSTTGYASVGLAELCRRMLELCDRLDEGNPIVPEALWRLVVMHCARGELTTALELTERLSRLDAAASPLLFQVARGMVLTRRGDIGGAREHLDRARAALPAHRNQVAGLMAETPEVRIITESALNRWLAGDPEAAERELTDALRLATQLGEATYAHLHALWFAGLVAVLRQDPELARARSDLGLELARRTGLELLVPFLRANRGWAMSRADDVEEAIAEIESASELATEAGTRMLEHLLLALLAEAHLVAGRQDEAARHARAGLVAADANDDRWYEPELHRLLGLALAEADRPAALASLRRAVDLADSQGSVALGDRARESLAQLD